MLSIQSTSNNGTRSPAMAPPSCKLSELPVARRFFWAPSSRGFHKLLDPGVTEKNFSSSERKLTANEVLSLALNEVAAERGQGYFWYLQSRNSGAREKFDPQSRKPEPAGWVCLSPLLTWIQLDNLDRASYPALVYAKFAWSDRERTAFFSHTHQFRLAASNFHFNAPRPATLPVSCFQVASDKQYALYTTEHRSYMILLNADACYFLPVATFEAIVGLWLPGSKKRTPRGPDAEKRLNTIQDLWTDPSQDPRCGLLERYRKSSVEDLYHDIVNTCNSANTPDPTVAFVRQQFPRPKAPEIATLLGTPLTAPLPTRHYGRLVRASRKSKRALQVDSDDGNDENTAEVK